MTGGVLPPGADAVVMVEDTEERDSVVAIKTSPKAGDNVQAAGLDAKRGQVVLEAGRRIGPAEVGMLATVGRTRVKVYPKPRVAVLATGDEVVEPEEEPPVGYVRDSNRYAVIAAATEAGGEVVWSGHANDDEATLAQAMRDALAVADVLITSGGVSMGTRDLIKPLFAELGEVHFGRIAFKPGKPLTFASVQRAGRGRRTLFGLPGFPVSSLVTFEVFVRPALRRLQGLRPGPPRPGARWSSATRSSRTPGGWSTTGRSCAGRTTAGGDLDGQADVQPADHDGRRQRAAGDPARAPSRCRPGPRSRRC